MPMIDRAPARIGVIADTSLQRHVLQQALTSNGYEVILNCDPQRIAIEDLATAGADLWLVDLAQSEDSPLVDSLLERAECPVLFGEGHAPERLSENYPRWERRLFGKLKGLVGDPSDAVGPSLEVLLKDAKRPERIELPANLAGQPLAEAPREVWLLAASMGGPEAVKAFLDALPGGLPVAFLYAQHIEASFESALPQAVGRHSQWQVKLAREGESLRCGEVVVVPVAQELRFTEDRSLQLMGRPWPEPYSPSIDQMMLNLGQRFGAHSGVIAFSGMGTDGSAAAAYVRRQGGAIWTQQADSCVCASMPDALREAGHSQLSGDPRALARSMVNRLASQLVAQPASSESFQ